jgi:hypothetical protein
MEPWELPDEILKIHSKYHQAVRQARDKVELEKKIIEDKGLTYVQTRAKKSLEHHKLQLETIDKMFNTKEEEYNSIILKAKEALDNLEKEKIKKVKEHEEAIERAEKEIISKPPSLIRAEALLEKAIKERDQVVKKSCSNSSQPLAPPSLPHHTHTPKKQDVCAMPLPVPPEEVFIFEGRKVLKFEYNLLTAPPKVIVHDNVFNDIVKDEDTEDDWSEVDDEELERRANELREKNKAMMKKPIKFQKKVIEINSDPNSPRSEAIVQDIIKSLNTPA